MSDILRYIAILQIHFDQKQFSAQIYHGTPKKFIDETLKNQIIY